MVLNSKDFDFLQSRGASSFNSEEDQRDSLLLRFDPLTRRSILSTQLKPTVQVIEETEIDLNRTSTPSGSSDRTVIVDVTPNEPPSNGNLVEVIDTMDNDTNSYMNNVR